jgi:hypothetical protein
MIFKPENLLVYDVEVAIHPDKVKGKWENPEGMGFASAVAYEYETDIYHFFLHNKGRLQLIELMHDRTAISFNGIKFDSRVVLGNERFVTHDGQTYLEESPAGDPGKTRVRGWDNIDLLLIYVQTRYKLSDVAAAEKSLGGPTVVHDGSFSLDGLAEGTLGLHKSGHGADAPALYEAQKFDELLAYNLNDVRLTRKLFDFLLEYGYLVDRKGRAFQIDLEIPSR